MSPKTILVVDDHSDTRVICRELFSHYGYAVLEAADGNEAVTMATTHLPDLVLLDFLMPQRDGLETLEVLRSHDVLVNRPIVLYTAAATHAAELEAVEGVQLVLYKPVEAARLLQVVRELIGEAG